jgi:serine/threonine protein kinase/Tfp pilus assembly protein PilF
MNAHQDEKNGIGRAKDNPAGAAQEVHDFVAARSLKRQLLAELRTSWEEGKPIPPEELLGRWPVHADADPDIASLLIEDYRQQRRQGQQLTSEEYSHRFPGQRDSLAGLLQHQAFLPYDGGRMLSLPAAGEELFGFRLLHELGRGSYARVFLAQQKELAARPVVVKVSAIDGDEPQRLAQLQHTHIMPIYSVHEDAHAGLRIVCMPYFGGASLAQVLRALWAQTNRPVHGKELVAALSTVRGPLSPAGETAPTTDGEPRTLWTRLAYVKAAAWIVACLAEALQHAHQRGVLHRDIKPSNILLSADGQPMLLDFNLAENLLEESAPVMASVGGTVAYMAPEHLLALATRDWVLVRKVDQRADLYGLGMVLYEALTGRCPFEHSGSYSPLPSQIEAMALERARFTPSLRQHRPDAPWSLESIVRKCLDPDPDHRYQQAEHLQEDLRRYLEDRPLRYAPELSWRERLSKWRCRHPRLAVNGMMAAAVVVLLSVGWAVLSQALTRAEGGDTAIALQRFLTDAAQARCFLNTTIGEYAPLREGLEYCERALGRYRVLQRADWQNQAVWRRLKPEEQRQVADEIAELLLLLARARIKRANELHEPMPPALENGLALLDRAERIGRAYAPAGTATSCTICADRAVYLESLGRTEEAQAAAKLAEANPPATFRDHYLRGASYADNGDYPAAIVELKKAVDLRPGDYWAHFFLGICFRNRQHYALAATEFRACTVLWPDFSWSYFNFGEALHHHGNRLEAIRAYTEAIERDPPVAQAHYNRGLVYLDMGAWQSALEDFLKVPPGAYPDDVLYGSRGIALLELGRDDEANAAFAQAWANGWTNLDLRLNYAFVISQRQPEEAQKIFREILRRNPRNAHALYGCGMLLEHQRRDSQEAAVWFSEALQSDPNFVEARLARALVYAHQDRGMAAQEDVALCVRQDPRGQTLYQAACFYALLASQGKEPLAASWTETALRLLEAAFKQGYGREKAVTDSDLDGIRQHPKFHDVLQKVTSDE